MTKVYQRLNNTFLQLAQTLFEDSSIPELLVATKQAKVYLLSRSNSATIPFRPKTYVQSNEDTYVTSSKYHTNTLSAEDEKKSINPEVTLVMQGQYGKITSLVPHPELPIFAVSGDSGILVLLD
ncbi:hypothetical protein HDV02_006456 [Globomyces sp. JEL0801]|nr:hypothetical protein HDV02_006456 [Globomyces sp. JEL0801]